MQRRLNCQSREVVKGYACVLKRERERERERSKVVSALRGCLLLGIVNSEERRFAVIVVRICKILLQGYKQPLYTYKNTCVYKSIIFSHHSRLPKYTRRKNTLSSHFFSLLRCTFSARQVRHRLPNPPKGDSFYERAHTYTHTRALVL